MEQEKALQLALDGHNIFLTGKAGTGKTYTLNKIIKALKKKEKVVAVTASTGIASTHINGKTIHSWSATGIKEQLIQDDLHKIDRNPFSSSRIKSAEVLIIDEISMLKSNKLDVVDEICRFVRRSRAPFGGLQVIVCGDFFQLPPVETSPKAKKSYCFKAKAWEEAAFKVCYLEKVYRQTDKKFVDLLNSIRKNDVSSEQVDILTGLNRPTPDMHNAVILYAKNSYVDLLNTDKLREIKEKVHIFEMEEKGDQFSLKTLKKNCVAQEKILLKKGAHVMFLRNYPERNIVNGTLGEVVEFKEYTRVNKSGDIIEEFESVPFVKIFKTGEIEAAYPDVWETTEFDIKTQKEKTVAKIVQTPLKLSWALTIHKSQGATFDYVNLDLSDVFEKGMGYVALSRATSLDGICLSGFNHTSLQVEEEVIEKDKEFLLSSREEIEESVLC